MGMTVDGRLRALLQCAGAGALGAVSSAFGKRAGSSSAAGSAPEVLAWWPGAGEAWPWLGRVGCYAMLLLCNAQMMSLQLRSVRVLPSLQANVVNTAANIAITGVLGRCLFAEEVSPRWLCGVTMILVGVSLVLHGSSKAADSEKTDGWTEQHGHSEPKGTTESTVKKDQ